MQASYLCEVALEFELKIRGIRFEGVIRAQRILRAALRAEQFGTEEPPNPQFDPREEWYEAKAYLERLEEQARLRSFTPNGLRYLCVYAQLCHLEKRISYVKWRKVENRETREMFRELAKQVAEFRTLHYPEHERFVIEDEHEIPIMTQPVWTDEHEEMLKEVEAKLASLKKKKADVAREITADVTVQKIVVKDQREGQSLNSQERTSKVAASSLRNSHHPKLSPSSNKKRAADENRGRKWKRKRLKKRKIPTRLNSQSRHKRKSRMREEKQIFAAKEFRQRFKISFKTSQEVGNNHATEKLRRWHASITRLKQSENCLRSPKAA